MTASIRIKIDLDQSVSSNAFFQRRKVIQVSKPHIFKYGIYKEQIPDFIQEDDFEYLEGKVPHLLGLNDDWIELAPGTIRNLASDEKAAEISELIGVGVGLYYATNLIGANPNQIRRIPHPETRNKILDFSILHDSIKYDIETKGTLYKGNVPAMKKDIREKKRASRAKAVRIGTIALARKPSDLDKSKVIVMDDFEIDLVEDRTTWLHTS